MDDDNWPIGWFTSDEAAMYSREANRIRNGVIVEVGVYMGRSLSRIAPLCRSNGNRLVAIDNWQGCIELDEVGKGIPLLERFRQNMEWLGLWETVEPMTGDSADSAANFADESIDLVFIDATHYYEPVKRDIRAWWPKLKPGGVLLGHDFRPGFGGLVRAVRELFGVPDELGGSVWKIAKKPGRNLRKN